MTVQSSRDGILRPFCVFLTSRVIPALSLVVFFLLFMLYFCIIRHMMAASPHNEVICAYVSQKFERQIPHHIHQMWKTKEFPKKWQAYQRKCSSLNPEYDYTLWDDNDIDAFLRQHYAWFVETYQSYPENVMRADSARYFILHHYGGVYIDGDMECKIPFDHLLNATSEISGAILAETSPWGMTNSFLAAKAGHPFMTMLTQGLMTSYAWYYATYLTILFSTGPFYIFKTYRGYPCQQHLRVLSVQEHEFYMRHDHASTWHGSEGPFIRWLDENHQTIIFLTVLLLICFFFITVRHLHRNGANYAAKIKHFIRWCW